ncbi:MAG TPA: hypothetical protein VFN02_03375, partial [Ktedonobacteraceae bacterium]|nr:hypothetical protein [Ktedonobacteraceae bacterium]
MSRRTQPFPTDEENWRWPLNLEAYDRTPCFSQAERAELRRLFSQKNKHPQIHQRTRDILSRLV